MTAPVPAFILETNTSPILFVTYTKGAMFSPAHIKFPAKSIFKKLYRLLHFVVVHCTFPAASILCTNAFL